MSKSAVNSTALLVFDTRSSCIAIIAAGSDNPTFLRTRSCDEDYPVVAKFTEICQLIRELSGSIPPQRAKSGRLYIGSCKKPQFKGPYPLKITVGAIVLTSAIGGQASALTLTEAVRLAWKNAPIGAQEELYKLSEDDVHRRLLPNEPQLQLTRSDDGATLSAGLSLTVGLPGKALALKSLDVAKAQSQREEIVAKRHEVARNAVQAFLDCAVQRATVTQQSLILQDQEDLFEELKRMYDAGRVTQGEVIGTELQVRQARSDLATSQDKAAVACHKLQAIIGQPGQTAEQTNYVLPEDLDQDLLKELGETTADELRAAGTGRIAKAMASSSTWAQLPDLTLSATRNHYILPSSPNGNDWTTTYALGITIPLLYGSYEEAEAKRARSQATLDISNADLALLQAKADVSDASGDYRRSLQRLAELHAKDLPLGAALYESIFSSYKSGKVGYAELVLARRTLSDLKAQEVQLKATIVAAHLRCLSRCVMPPAATQETKS